MNMLGWVEVAVPIAVVVVAVIVYLIFPRVRGLHYTSRLTCPKCGKQFDYEWVPGGSFSAVRLVNKRHIRCPNCHAWSTFEILTTRAKKTDNNPSTKEPEIT
jgi:DNA-directed RNA polymerase subunit RPC12/RpoP